MDRWLIGLGAFMLIALGWAIGFGIFSGIVWLICWAFDLTFTWKYAFGVWIIWLMVSGIFKTKVTVKQESEYDRNMREADRWLR